MGAVAEHDLRKRKWPLGPGRLVTEEASPLGVPSATLAWWSAKTLDRLAGMDPGSEAIVLGGPSSDHLVISEIRWAFPGAAIEFDRTMLEASFELDSGPWRVIVKGHFPESHLAGLKGGLEVLYRDLVGSASPATRQPPLVSSDLDGDGKGHIQLSGEIREGPMLENRLTFTLPAFDQTYLPAIITAVDTSLMRLHGGAATG